jgi:solute carrier family 30 (zinc transporter), member 1
LTLLQGMCRTLSDSPGHNLTEEIDIFIFSLIVVAILVYGSFGLAKRMVLVVMQSTPPSLNAEKIEKKVRKIKGVLDVHDIHLWSLDESRTIASVHVVCKKMSSFKRISVEIRSLLHRLGVHSTTVQPEFEKQDDEDTVPLIPGSCRATCASPECSDLRCCTTDPVQRRVTKRDASDV